MCHRMITMPIYGSMNNTWRSLLLIDITIACIAVTAAYYIGKRQGAKRTTEDYIYKPGPTKRGDKALAQFLGYVNKYSAPEDEIVQELRKWSDKLEFRGRETPKYQTQFLNVLVRLLRPKKILEVGTFTGVSTLSMALALPKDGHIKTIEFEQKFIDHGKIIWDKSGVGNKITAIVDDAGKAMDDLIEANEKGTYDIVFIDCDKWNYHKYFTKALTLLRQGGVILIDDTLWEGLVCDPKYTKDGNTEGLPQLDQRRDVKPQGFITFSREYSEHVAVFMYDFNKKVATDERVMATILPIANGLTIAIKK